MEFNFTLWLEREHDEEQRLKAQDAVNKVSVLIKSIAQETKRDELRFFDFFQQPRYAEYTLDLGRYLPEVFNGKIWFVGDGEDTCGLGHSKVDNRPAIMIHYKGDQEHFQDEFPKRCSSWFSAKSGGFFHEYIHYLDIERTGGKVLGGSGDMHRAGNIAGYTNDPAELNAHYFSIIQGYYRRLDFLTQTPVFQGRPPEWRQEQILAIIGSDFREFYSLVSRYNETYLSYLTPENRQRFIKRLAGGWHDLRRYADRLVAGGT